MFSFQIDQTHMFRGVGYINLHDYYSASVLTQLKEWFLPSLSTHWGSTEEEYSPHNPIKLWLYSTQLGAQIPSYFSPTIIAAIKTWVRLLQQTQRYTPNTTLDVPLSAPNHLIAQVSLTTWTKKVITHLHSLYDKGSLKYFPSIQKEFDLKLIYTNIYKSVTVLKTSHISIKPSQL